MKKKQIHILINEIAYSPIALTSFILDENIKNKIISKFLDNKKRFLCFYELNNLIIIPKYALLKSLIQINIRVSSFGISSISEKDFLNLLAAKLNLETDLLYKNKKLIGNYIKKWFLAEFYQEQVLLPLADLMSGVSLLELLTLLQQAEEELNFENLKKHLYKVFNFIFKFYFSQRDLEILQKRFGFEGKIYTLEKVGKPLGLSRERIRQIENRFWRYATHLSKSDKHLLEKEIRRLLILGLIVLEGKRLYTRDDATYPIFKFICRLLNMNFKKIPKLKLYFLGGTKDQINKIEKLLKEPTSFAQHNHLFPKGIFLTKREILFLKNESMLFLKNKDIIHLVLKRIGRPAHYSEIALVCNNLYPEKHFVPRNVHATLSREYSEDLPWVWTGIRGVFALKEWGYQRPQLDLYQAVTKIVEERYSQTKRPVAIPEIVAGLSKYRPLTKKSSLTFALSLNKKITKVGRQGYVPVSKAESLAKNNSFLDDLNNKLQSFLKKNIEVN